MRWGYLARLAVAGAVFVAAVYEWESAAAGHTLLASVACVAALLVTAGEAIQTELRRVPLSRGFLYAHAAFDLLLVTAVVHLTGGLESQFAALYILVIGSAALLLPGGGGLLVAALGVALYMADAVFGGHGAPFDATAWLQLAVFAAVAASGALITARLRDAGAVREELAAELARARLQASDILNDIRSGIVTVNAEGRLLYANPAAGALLGLQLGRASGRVVLPVIATAAPELAEALERGVREGARTTRAEGTITLGGRAFPIGVTTTISVLEGRGTTVTAIFQDLSESKRLEALHLRAQRLEAVAALSASLAHEIRNPLASIRSAVEQLAAMPQAGDDERTLGGLIVRESDRLSRLLAEFLDFARVRVTRVAPVDVAAVAEAATALAATHPDRDPGITVRWIPPSVPVVVEGDEDLLHRAVFNLVLNAVQATSAPGEVRVEVAPVEQDALSGGVVFDRGAVALRVSDTGAGIPPELRESLFEPFVTTKVGGTGLGLAVVHRAVEAHLGLVFVDGDDRGARFTVLLPVTRDGADDRLPDGAAAAASAAALRPTPAFAQEALA
ncbi:MAG TPA: ATP-binding protein [Gemmatimonadales bacterium]